MLGLIRWILSDIKLVLYPYKSMKVSL